MKKQNSNTPTNPYGRSGHPGGPEMCSNHRSKKRTLPSRDSAFNEVVGLDVVQDPRTTNLALFQYAVYSSIPEVRVRAWEQIRSREEGGAAAREYLRHQVAQAAEDAQASLMDVIRDIRDKKVGDVPADLLAFLLDLLTYVNEVIAQNRSR